MCFQYKHSLETEAICFSCNYVSKIAHNKKAEAIRSSLLNSAFLYSDKKLEKCTYVSKYGLQGAKKILEEITKEAIEELKEYGDKAEFLRKLALYIKDRNK